MILASFETRRQDKQQNQLIKTAVNYDQNLLYTLNKSIGQQIISEKVSTASIKTSITIELESAKNLYLS